MFCQYWFGAMSNKHRGKQTENWKLMTKIEWQACNCDQIPNKKNQQTNDICFDVRAICSMVNPWTSLHTWMWQNKMLSTETVKMIFHVILKLFVDLFNGDHWICDYPMQKGNSPFVFCLVRFEYGFGFSVKKKNTLLLKWMRAYEIGTHLVCLFRQSVKNKKADARK